MLASTAYDAVNSAEVRSNVARRTVRTPFPGERPPPLQLAASDGFKRTVVTEMHGRWHPIFEAHKQLRRVVTASPWTRQSRSTPTSPASRVVTTADAGPVRAAVVDDAEGEAAAGMLLLADAMDMQHE